MIEVNLYSIPAGESSARAGRCIARNRFDRDAMGVTAEEFVKGFLKNNLEKFEGGIGNDALVEAISSSNRVLTRRDLSCINHFLVEAGYMFQIINVADDEENPVGIPSGEKTEWNIIDRNFIQNDYPTATKIIPADRNDLTKILHQIVDQSGLFDSDKFSGLKNPFTKLLNDLDSIKSLSGQINYNLVNKIYDLLSECGLDIFVAASEE